MKIIEVVVSYGQTIQQKKFEPNKYFVSLKAEVDYDEDLIVVTTLLFDRAKKAVDRAIVEDE